MDPVELVGYGAAACTTFSFLPQVLRTWRTKSAEDLSPGMFAVYMTGIVLWLSYGLLIRNPPIVAANLVGFGLVGFQVALMIRYRRAARRHPATP